MKQIVFQLLFIALLLTSCHSDNKDNRSASQPISRPACQPISCLEIISGEDHSSKTLKYDSSNRLIEILPENDSPTKISYQNDIITVTDEEGCFVTTYEISGDTIMETGKLINSVYTFKEGKIYKSNRDFTIGRNYQSTYKWEENCLKEIVTDNDGYINTTTYKYSNIQNPFSIDVFDILDNFELAISSLVDGFNSEFLPEEITWEGTMFGYLPMKTICTCGYVFNDGLISEIHMAKHNISPDEGRDEPENIVVKITY